MAGDLIPPPSPAGRPEQPGGGSTEPPPPRRWLSGGETAVHVEERAERREREDPPAPAPEPRLAPDSPYRPRFGFLFGALIGVAIAAAVLAYLLIAGGGSGAPEGWSKWKPDSDERLTAAAQIAAHVAPKYRQENGDQLVMVNASDLELRDVPLEVVIRNRPPAGIQRIDGDGVLYTLAGFGPLGSIEKGKATEARHRLLRREALELALLTFRYAKGVDLVVALLPPRGPEEGKPPQTAFTALLFRPGDLEAQLDAPSLQVTVPEDRTPRVASVNAEAPRIDALTRPNLFLASIRQVQDARLYLVLDRLPTP